MAPKRTTPTANQFIKGVLKLLPGRTRKSFRIAHVLYNGTEYRSLDLNLAAPSVDALVEAMLTLLASLKPDDILPAAGDDLWTAYTLGEFAGNKLIPSKLGRFGLINVMIRRPK